jgi:hypothetical protein
MILTKRDELSFLYVLAFPKAEKEERIDTQYI